MSDPRDRERPDDLTPEAERAWRALGAAREAEPAPPRADAALRERLREEFASGRFAAAEGRDPAVEPAQPARPARPVREDSETRARRPWLLRPLPRLAALAAAAMLAFFLADLANRGNPWILLEASGTGEILFDGEPIPVARADLIAERLQPGVEVELPASAKLEILSAKTLLVELTPGTRLTIPPPPPRFYGRNAELWTRDGLLRITTGPSFAGARLDVHTPDAWTRIDGTTVAVIMEPTGTCVCVLEGRAMVGRQSGGPMMAVAPGRRAYVFRDGSPLATDSIREAEMVSLARFRSTRLHVLEGGEGLPESAK
ncbi:MAG TPA: hypothetical protein VFP58_12355 [Candidatus Eisenbacteria bacterium]|nr:hypothetical protein [Candidatus Eisenbacteria bacterium]